MEIYFLWTVLQIRSQILQKLCHVQRNVDQSPQSQRQKDRVDCWRRCWTFFADSHSWMQMGTHFQGIKRNSIWTLSKKSLQRPRQNYQEAISSLRFQRSEPESSQIPQNEAGQIIHKLRHPQLLSIIPREQMLKIEIKRRGRVKGQFKQSLIARILWVQQKLPLHRILLRTSKSIELYWQQGILWLAKDDSQRQLPRAQGGEKDQRQRKRWAGRVQIKARTSQIRSRKLEPSLGSQNADPWRVGNRIQPLIEHQSGIVIPKSQLFSWVWWFVWSKLSPGQLAHGRYG